MPRFENEAGNAGVLDDVTPAGIGDVVGRAQHGRRWISIPIPVTVRPISHALPLPGATIGAGHATRSSRFHFGQTSLAFSTAYLSTVCALFAMAFICDGNGATCAAGGESQVAGTLVGVSVGPADGARAGDLVRGRLGAPAGAPHTVRAQVLVQQTAPTLAAPDPCARTLAVAVVGNREFVAALLASSLFESAEALITLAVRSADRSTASRCLALWTAHAPRPSSTHHALLSLFAPHFRATLSTRTTLYTSTKNPPEKETSAIQILLRVCSRCCCVRRATVFSRDALR